MATQSTMSYQQATEQAIQLKKQGMTYPKIEEHFKAMGYKSPKTKEPVGHLAIRHMVTKAEKDRKQQAKKESKEEEKEIQLVSAGFRETVRKLAEVPGIDENTFLNLMKALVTQQEKQGKRATA
jgi:hypothetical protein